MCVTSRRDEGLRRDEAVAPSASDAAVGARLAAARVRSLNPGMPRRRDAHAVVASRIWAASVDAEAAEVARARREALEASVREDQKARGAENRLESARGRRFGPRRPPGGLRDLPGALLRF